MLIGCGLQQEFSGMSTAWFQFLLLSVDISGLHILIFFSREHKLHLLPMFEYDLIF